MSHGQTGHLPDPDFMGAAERLQFFRDFPGRRAAATPRDQTKNTARFLLAQGAATKGLKAAIAASTSRINHSRQGKAIKKLNQTAHAQDSSVPKDKQKLTAAAI